MRGPGRKASMAIVAVCVSLAVAAHFAFQRQGFETGSIPDPVILLPQADEVAGSVFLLSDADGWNTQEERTAQTLRAAGVIVVGIDLPRYLAALESVKDECVYLVSDIETLNQQIQRRLGNADYILPTVAGAGAGGALALAIAAQTPSDTVDETVAVDPLADVALSKALCTPAKRQATGSGAIYALTDGDLPNPVTVLLTPGATEAGRSHIRELHAGWPAIEVKEAQGDAVEAMEAALKPETEPGTGGHLATLPLDILETAPTHDAMAIVLSGDGGWRDLDRTIGLHFQAEGLPTVGLDSLRYFWSKKTAGETAADLSAIMDAYRAKWGAVRVALVGYSFGADVLPAAYLAMDKAHREMVTQVSLLGFSENADFQISVSGWLGYALGSDGSTLPDLAKIDPALVQCIYGRDETDTACPTLKDTQVELIETTGGHHFDGNYARLANLILEGLERRGAAQPAAK